MNQRSGPLSAAVQFHLRQEALFGRLPLLTEERTLNAPRSVAAGINAAMLAWCFLVGGYTANVMDATTGAIALLTGSLSSVVLVTLVLVGCNRWGCDATDISKPCLGQRGAKVILLIHLACQLSWAGLVLIMFGRGIQALVFILGLATGEPVVRLTVALGILLVWFLVSYHNQTVALLTTAATPGALTLAALVLFVVFREVTFADLARIPPVVDVAHREPASLAAFTYGLGAGLCWWPTIAHLMRNSRSVRAAVYPQILTMGVFTGAMASLGLWAALLFRSYDPNDWLEHMGGSTFGLLTLTCLACTHIAGSAASLSSIAHSLRHVRYLRRLQWPALTALSLAPLLPLVGMASYVYARGHILLVLIAYALTPVAGVLALDYFTLRHQRINLSQIYDDSHHAIYWYWGGFNWAALACIAVGVLVSLSGFNPVTHTAHPLLRALGGAPVGTVVTMVLHSLCVHFFFKRRGIGGYRAPTAPQAILYDNL